MQVPQIMDQMMIVAPVTLSVGSLMPLLYSSYITHVK